MVTNYPASQRGRRLRSRRRRRGWRSGRRLAAAGVLRDARPRHDAALSAGADVATLRLVRTRNTGLDAESGPADGKASRRRAPPRASASAPRQRTPNRVADPTRSQMRGRALGSDLPACYRVRLLVCGSLRQLQGSDPEIGSDHSQRAATLSPKADFFLRGQTRTPGLTPDSPDYPIHNSTSWTSASRHIITSAMLTYSSVECRPAPPGPNRIDRDAGVAKHRRVGPEAGAGDRGGVPARVTASASARGSS